LGSARMFFSTFMGIALSAALFYLAFRNVPLRELILYLRQVEIGWIAPSLMVILGAFFIRAERLRLIISASHPLSFSPVYHPLAIGYLANCIVPGRLGEIILPVLLKKNKKVPLSTGLAAVVAERIFDLITLLLLFTCVIPLVRLDPSQSTSFAGYELSTGTLHNLAGKMMILCVLLLLCINLVTIQATKNWIKGILHRLSSMSLFASSPNAQSRWRKTCHLAETFLDNIASGFSLVRSASRLALCVFYSLAIWGLVIFANYLLTFGCPRMSGLSYTEISVMTIFIGFFVALPSAPGFWGVWEAGGIFALSVFGINTTDAAGYTLLNHVVQIGTFIVLGVVSALLTEFNWRNMLVQKSSSHYE